MTVTAEMINHCNQYKMCKGCRFNGNDCVAPLANYNDKSYQDWIKSMGEKIKEARL